MHKPNIEKGRRIYLKQCTNCKEYHRTTRVGKSICPLCKKTAFYPRVFYKNRKLALIRDGHTCQCCGGKVKNLVHHIDCNKMNNIVSNLITLCDQCHLSLHGRHTNKELRLGNIYKMFPKKFRWGIFGKRWDINDSESTPVKKVKKIKTKFINIKRNI